MSPITSLPGTPAKVDELRRRASLRLSLFLPGDRPLTDEDTVPTIPLGRPHLLLDDTPPRDCAGRAVRGGVRF